MATRVRDFTTTADFGNNTLHCEITETTNDTTNVSNLGYRVWVSGNGYEYNYNNHLELTIGGTEIFNGDPGRVADGEIVLEGSIIVSHSANGTGSTTVYCFYRTLRADYTYYTPTINETFDLLIIPRYKLTINAGSGSSISVKRISSRSGSIGDISNNSSLYYDDVLTVTFSANTNYAIATHTLNGNTFASGGSHTVSGNVSIVSTAIVLASNVGATDANIESVSSIVVTKYDNSYYHSLYYTFGTLSGYLTKEGRISQTEVKFSETNVPFTIPTTFYYEIPNAKSGVCTITCRTYKNSTDTTVLGNPTTCTFVATASEARCAPDMWCIANTLDEESIHMTGNDSTMIRYISMVSCINNPTAQNGASITQRTLNGDVITGDPSEPEFVVEPETNKFVFTATDSRGYTSTSVITLTSQGYIPLTCNPILARTSPTGSTLKMTLSGNFYNRNMGARYNKLTIKYRYKEDGDPSFGSYTTVTSGITYTGTTYKTTATLTGPFDYTKTYIFEIYAADGDDANGYILTSLTKEVTVLPGIPVFDWGKDDFNVNVPINYKGESIFDYLYPPGIIVTTVNNTLPTLFSEYGVWVSVQSALSGAYSWQRVY